MPIWLIYIAKGYLIGAIAMAIIVLIMIVVRLLLGDKEHLQPSWSSTVQALFAILAWPYVVPSNIYILVKGENIES